MSNKKISIRFFDDREVRAVWDEQNAKWWFSVLDFISAKSPVLQTSPVTQ
jgi:cell filamentation protein